MTDDVKVSIVVPVYNAEKTLNRCIDSILQQSYTNWELLLVDDGSTDGSKEICVQYSKKDERIMCYSKANGGVSSARNYGIEKAQGEFVLFIDSDDWIEDYTLQTMINKTMDYDVDYIIPRCRGVYYSEDGVLEKYVFDNDDYEMSISSTEIRQSLEKMWNDSLLFSVCGRLYKRELLIKWNVRFNEQLKVLEDLCFNLECLRHVNNVLHISKVTYNYTIVDVKKYFNKRSYVAFVNGIDRVFRNIQSFLDEQKIDDRIRYVDFVVQYWIMAVEAVMQNEEKRRKSNRALKQITNYVEDERLMENATIENIDTHYKVLFYSKSVILFRIVVKLKRIKGKLRNVQW